MTKFVKKKKKKKKISIFIYIRINRNKEKTNYLQKCMLDTGGVTHILTLVTESKI
jgi:hypothetical protein